MCKHYAYNIIKRWKENYFQIKFDTKNDHNALSGRLLPDIGGFQYREYFFKCKDFHGKDKTAVLSL